VISPYIIIIITSAIVGEFVFDTSMCMCISILLFCTIKMSLARARVCVCVCVCVFIEGISIFYEI
jgi:hypothetical protein